MSTDRDPAQDSTNEVFGAMGFEAGETVYPAEGLGITLDDLRGTPQALGEEFPAPGFDPDSTLRVRLYCEFNVTTGELDQTWFQQIPDDPEPDGDIIVDY